MVYAFKMAGAAADKGGSLDEVANVAQKAADACRSIGMALTPCTIPISGQATFEIGEDEMEMGMGIHGEPGIWRDKLKGADEIADEMCDRILEDNKLGKGDVASVLVNSLGATPPEELYILYRRIKKRFDEAGIEIRFPLVGRYATSMEMSGATLTVCTLDDELESLLRAPASCAFWQVG